jgi:hypothetical protein
LSFAKPAVSPKVDAGPDRRFVDHEGANGVEVPPRLGVSGSDAAQEDEGLLVINAPLQLSDLVDVQDPLVVGVPVVRIQPLVVERIRSSLAGASVQPAAMSILVDPEGFIASSAQFEEDGGLSRAGNPRDIDEGHECSSSFRQTPKSRSMLRFAERDTRVSGRSEMFLELA